MRWAFSLALAGVVIPAVSEVASAHPIRNRFCYPYAVPVVPVAPVAGSFGFGSYGGFGGYGFGATGFGATTYGWNPVALAPNGGFGNGGFGAQGGDFGFDPATAALAIEIIRIIQAKRAGGGGPAPLGGGPPPLGGGPPPLGGGAAPNADLAAIHMKLDAILYNQAVQSVQGTKILETVTGSDKKLDEAMKKIDSIRVKVGAP